jgi:predicted membrane channel-forming protein YqfA (hemolysin III family)
MTEKGNINEDNQAGPRWLVWGFVALTVLIILLGLAFLVSGREIIERPVLIIFLLFAWLGVLAGIALGRSSD